MVDGTISTTVPGCVRGRTQFDRIPFNSTQFVPDRMIGRSLAGSQQRRRLTHPTVDLTLRCLRAAACLAYLPTRANTTPCDLLLLPDVTTPTARGTGCQASLWLTNVEGYGGPTTAFDLLYSCWPHLFILLAVVGGNRL